MDRWTIKELDEMDGISFAIRILLERGKKISPYSPLGKKLAKTIHELQALKEDVTDFSDCDEQTKATILENAAKLEERDRSKFNFYGKKFSQDKAAHQTYAFATDERNMLHSAEERCVHCGGRLQTYYCEEKLYIIRCNECSIAAPVKARNPSEAASRTIGG